MALEERVGSVACAKNDRCEPGAAIKKHMFRAESKTTRSEDDDDAAFHKHYIKTKSGQMTMRRRKKVNCSIKRTLRVPFRSGATDGAA